MPRISVLGMELLLEDHPEVYPPSEDTFLMAGALGPLRGRALDLGTGSGLLAILCARMGASVLATDLNPHALALARRNAGRNGVEIEVLRADLFEGVAGKFDLVLFNPPYLPTGPGDLTGDRWLDLSVDGGRDGLAPARRFLEGLGAHLAPRGRALTLVSSLSQATLEPPPGLVLRPVATGKLEFELLTVLEARRAPGRGGPAPRGRARNTNNP